MPSELTHPLGAAVGAFHSPGGQKSATGPPNRLPPALAKGRGWVGGWRGRVRPRCF